MLRSFLTFKKDVSLIEDPRERVCAAYNKVAQWSTVRFAAFIRLNKDTEAVMRTIDVDGFEALRKKHNYGYPLRRSGPFRTEKWFDIKARLPANLRRIYRLGLQTSKQRMKVLDIGGGAGYFCYLCRYFGHEAETIDVGDHEEYNDCVSFFNIRRTIWRVERFKRLPPVEKRFDIVTAFLITFNKHNMNEEDLWKCDAWEFFLNDLAHNVLTKTGQVFLVMNQLRDGTHYDSDLVNYFISRGAKVNGREVHFDSMEKFQKW